MTMTTPFLLKKYVPNIIIFLHTYSLVYTSCLSLPSGLPTFILIHLYPVVLYFILSHLCISPSGLILYLISSISPSGLPTGFIPNDEILNAERPNLPPPPTIYYVEKHVRPYFISLIALIVLIEPVFKHGQLQVE